MEITVSFISHTDVSIASNRLIRWSFFFICDTPTFICCIFLVGAGWRGCSLWGSRDELSTCSWNYDIPTQETFCFLLTAWHQVTTLDQEISKSVHFLHFHVLINIYFFNFSHRGNDESHSVLMLDFGEDVHLRKAVTKQLLIKNESIIPADFTIKPEFFDCNISAANSSLEKRSKSLLELS